MVESSTADILNAFRSGGFITTQRLCTEIIEDSLPRVADTEREDMRLGALARPQAADMRSHLEATRGHPAASSAAIAGQPLTGALKGTEATQALGPNAGNRGFSGGERGFAGRGSSAPRSGGFSGSGSRGYSSSGASGGSHGGGNSSGGGHGGKR